MPPNFKRNKVSLVLGKSDDSPRLKLKISSEPWHNMEIIEVVDMDDKNHRMKKFLEKDKIVIHCPKCHTNWMNFKYPKTCPFCGWVF